MVENKIVLKAENLFFTYKSKGENLEILNNLNLEVLEKETIAIIGSSGTGKSTLLHILAGLDIPDQGKVQLCNQDFVIAGKKQNKYHSMMRNKYMGFVYQFHHLLAEFSALENVSLPLRIQGENKKIAEQKASEILQRVGLEKRIKHKPAELSGGERQRAAIARALVTKPKCILADEPTGNLDNENSAIVFDLMCKLVKEEGSAMIIVTHDSNLASKTDKILKLNSGKLNHI